MKDIIKKIFEDSIKVKKEFILDDANVSKIAEAAKTIIDSYSRGGKVIVFGNGGSAADSQHFAAELMIRFEKERRSLPCIALSTNTSNLTAASNDYGYDSSFSRQLEGLAKEGDVAVAVSTSGNSKNVLDAAKKARSLKIPVIGLLGRDGGKLAGISDIPIIVKDQNTARVQEAHGVIMHALCKIIEDNIS